MIRIGRYDAFDKWSILCRYWEDNALVPDLGCNKFERPRLTVWHEAAARSAGRACIDYLRGKADGLRGALPEASNLPGRADSVHAEIASLLRQMSYADLQMRVLAFAQAMTQPGVEGRAASGFSPELLERLRQVWQEGALRGLQWTDEANEIPTIEILREQTSISFPQEAVRNKKNVLSLFSAHYYGRSDVIHIYDAAPGRMTLVDLDRHSLDDMQRIYPKAWTYVHQDFASFLRDAEEKGLSYDLIVSDPYRGHGQTIAWEFLPLVMRLCSDTFITNYFVEMFDELGVGPEDLARLSRAIAVRTGVAVEVTQTVHRSGDVHWVVMRKPVQAASGGDAT
jgi:hypothetical protein